jgi:hypothetical protein
MKRLAPIAILLASGCGGPLFFAELEVPTVRVTLPSQSFPAANDPSALCRDAQGNVIPQCAQTVLAYDLGAQVPVITEKGVSYEVRLTSLGIALAANDPIMSDFGTVTAVTISVVGTGGLPNVVVASYQQDPLNPAPKSITVAGYSNVDLAPYILSGTLDLKTELHGIPPSFTADVAGTFYLKVKLDYGAYL